MKTSSKERRHDARTPTRIPLDIVDPKGQMVVGEGRFLNLSTHGGMIESRKPLKERSAVRLQVVPAKKPALELVGKIVWARKKTPGFIYGIRFKSQMPGSLT